MARYTLDPRHELAMARTGEAMQQGAGRSRDLPARTFGGRATSTDREGRRRGGSGVGGWLRSLFSRETDIGEPEPRFVRVWDAERGTYRSVNLHDRTDPLWSAAWALTGCSNNRTRRARRPAA